MTVTCSWDYKRMQGRPISLYRCSCDLTVRLSCLVRVPALVVVIRSGAWVHNSPSVWHWHDLSSVIDYSPPNSWKSARDVHRMQANCCSKLVEAITTVTAKWNFLHNIVWLTWGCALSKLSQHDFCEADMVHAVAVFICSRFHLWLISM